MVEQGNEQLFACLVLICGHSYWFLLAALDVYYFLHVERSRLASNDVQRHREQRLLQGLDGDRTRRRC